MKMHRSAGQGAAALVWALLAAPVLAQQGDGPADEAVEAAHGVGRALFLQLGSSGDTRQFAAGVLLPWSARWRVGSGELSGYWDLSLSRWQYPRESDRRHSLLSQLGAKPTLRWAPGGGWGRGFIEFGVGATLMSDLYRSNGKRFSTRFNFGSHLAIGMPLDAQHTQELMLRIEHFSNAGVRHPNPGAEFVQLRYAHRF